jgi:hypothetical protein
MTRGAECDQVLIGVVAGVAAELFVMDFQVRHRSAGLAPPAIAPQNLLPTTRVCYAVKPRYFWANPVHERFLALGSRGMLAFCSPGRRLKNLVIE